ncbi:MAG: tRNA (adenosine(37)-N6)-threonylcarbamoyltransferase complex ATPase subunit type 1 TsaE [Bacteroidetes bacterium]|nr:tRNA (adenosine(37)-N6)-threonylcarbamoyltransferase complex ATPase subunit type 1 TsaE [Bacteroidota bacterium]
MLVKAKTFNNIKIEDLDVVAEYLIKNYYDIKIWLFQGQLGAGKTSLIKTICSKLNVIDIVNSPTYNIINEYKRENNEYIYHFDLYRLNDFEELINIGYEDYIDSGFLCFIEWPQIIEKIIDKAIFIKIEINDQNNRNLKIYLLDNT